MALYNLAQAGAFEKARRVIFIESIMNFLDGKNGVPYTRLRRGVIISRFSLPFKFRIL